MSEALIYKKMSGVMSEIGAIGKNQKNVQQGFKFRGIDDFVNSLYPALTKHGVFMTPRCVSERTDIRDVVRSSGKAGVDKHVTIMMEYDFFAEDGSKVTVGPIPGEAVDSGDKATNKALSASLKYALIQTFSIPTEDMAEGDKETIELGSISKAENLKKSAPEVSSGSTTLAKLETAAGKLRPDGVDPQAVTSVAPAEKKGFGSRFGNKKTETKEIY